MPPVDVSYRPCQRQTADTRIVSACRMTPRSKHTKNSVTRGNKALSICPQRTHYNSRMNTGMNSKFGCTRKQQMKPKFMIKRKKAVSCISKVKTRKAKKLDMAKKVKRSTKFSIATGRQRFADKHRRSVLSTRKKTRQTIRSNSHARRKTINKKTKKPLKINSTIKQQKRVSFNKKQTRTKRKIITTMKSSGNGKNEKGKRRVVTTDIRKHDKREEEMDANHDNVDNDVDDDDDRPVAWRTRGRHGVATPRTPTQYPAFWFFRSTQHTWHEAVKTAHQPPAVSRRGVCFV